MVLQEGEEHHLAPHLGAAPINLGGNEGYSGNEASGR